ncbi:hypothetical protein C491_15647 [Natronococcus amylolyticus DSM 10524]|uniref:Uncharacterized protein n=1 Tax=Natronococcus amylolyticus DSM 10524 TaxID=1227497 RepID=L9X1H6_9EURY|nr:hypothetical protein [Natronococcus amylolyticus]ELY55614.1 hypothetical protein C491_15647 [Natronococcus amylolyticus DSM 10524]
MHRSQGVPRERLGGFILKLSEEFDLAAVWVQYLECSLNLVPTWMVCLSPLAHAGQFFAVLSSEPVLSAATRDDADIEAGRKDGQQSTDRLAFSSWGVFERAVDCDCERRWLVVGNVGGEELGSREQVLETRMPLPEVWHEVGRESPGFSSVAAGDLEYS